MIPYFIIVYILYELGQIVDVNPWIWVVTIGLSMYKLWDAAYKIGKMSKDRSDNKNG